MHNGKVRKIVNKSAQSTDWY